MGKVHLQLQDGSRASGGSVLQSSARHKTLSDPTNPRVKLHHLRADRISLFAYFKAENDAVSENIAQDSAKANTSDVYQSHDEALPSTWLGLCVLDGDVQSEKSASPDPGERATHPIGRPVPDTDGSLGTMDLKSLGARPDKQDVDNWVLNYRARCRQQGESLRCPACGGIQRRPSALKD
ncbi:hypothetical protein FRC06_000134 [Ceratobasidium sp. 370]|nr:hypothetical protein FRC06_000134 [Ceratobasidium sp. 370]